MTTDFYMRATVVAMFVIAACLLVICIKYASMPNPPQANQAKGNETLPVRIEGFTPRGDTVTERQTVAVIESMKMETPLHAPRSGRVSQIRRKAGVPVNVG